MARKPRIHFSGALYHVITRGNRREAIFRDEEDLERCHSNWPLIDSFIYLLVRGFCMLPLRFKS